MPRAMKSKASAGGAGKKVAAKKKKNGYVMPEPLHLGSVLTDLSRKSWKIGPSIGTGGFGEIYSACRLDSAQKNVADYEYVVKIEPHVNGPLFVEMHFYMRNAKQEDIKTFCKSHNLKVIGMPYLVGSGSHEINGIKHRFLIIPRYGSDVQRFYVANGKRLPQHTGYRLAIQMLYVYEFIHNCNYVHADLKGANILLEYGKKPAQQAFLVDYGLACHYTTDNFKPDPKKMHNGTIEYTSRDAHQGVPTMRGDMEILGYNLIHWSGVQLPWEREKLLEKPQKVQESKEKFINNLETSFKNLFTTVPHPILQYLQYVKSLEFNQKPDYTKCRKIFEAGIKALKKPLTGALEMSYTISSPSSVKGRTKQVTEETINSDDDNDNEVDDDNDEIDGDNEVEDEIVNSCPKISPIKRRLDAAKSPPFKKLIVTKSPVVGSRKATVTKKTKTIKPVINIKRNDPSTPDSARKQSGRTIVNNNLTPNPNSTKMCTVDVELDVSVDTNVVINIHRKRKATKNSESENLASPRKRFSTTTSPLARATPSKTPTNRRTPGGGGDVTPKTRIRSKRSN